MRLHCYTFILSLALAAPAIAQDDVSVVDDLPVASPTSSEDLPVAKPTADDADPVATAVTSSTSMATRPLSVTITLSNQSVIRGTLTDTTEVQMKTGFGELMIPLSEAAGIRFASQEDTSTTIVMLNGDSVTGATDVKRLTIDTEWGAAQVNGASIASILLVPNLQWSSIAGLNGKRWYLTESNPQPTSPSTGTNRSTSQSPTLAPSNSFPANTGVLSSPQFRSR
ncbi:hypothetical protein Poly24_47950 [Rosistilla carotiformis]|uniref:Uncharacterized protein n=1 Tax=Rosistilla carotiformis TaxID=2528017 RepID=A0A518JZU5_9BACT|nr:hypothetical protein [Rosistilla carotiformis]QDV71062.1 hypothetical protein Poly24_47950 [Rosistilla carotiformis]